MKRDVVKKELIAKFPIVEGVEIRTMGESLRPLRLFSKSAGKHTVVSELLIVDDENNLFQEVPKVMALNFDFSQGKSYVGGRLIRLTNDVIVHAVHGDERFQKGYERADCNQACRLVSEPFMIYSIETVDAVKLAELMLRAKVNSEKYKAQLSCCND